MWAGDEEDDEDEEDDLQPPLYLVPTSVQYPAMRSLALLLFAFLTPLARAVPVAYQLPTDGPLPKTYRVTLAIVEAKNPNWIVSQFSCGVVRTVTAENKGKF